MSDDGGQTAAVALTLHAPATPRPLGQPAAISVEIRNTSDEEIWWVGVVDGSEEGVRYPYYRPTVFHGDDIVATPPPPEDPLVAPLRVVDFRRLAPNESFDPSNREAGAYLPLATFATFVPHEAGIYRYQLTASTESDNPEQWLGRFGQDTDRVKVLELAASVPRLTLTAHVDISV